MTLQKPDNNELAIDRSTMAADRTLMAWTRTAISLIGFGFTIYKFLQAMVEQNKTLAALPIKGPRNLGLAFIGLGIAALAIAALQNWLYLKRFGGRGGLRPFNLSLAVASAVVLIGVLAFVNVLFHIGPF